MAHAWANCRQKFIRTFYAVSNHSRSFLVALLRTRPLSRRLILLKLLYPPLWLLSWVQMNSLSLLRLLEIAGDMRVFKFNKQLRFRRIWLQLERDIWHPVRSGHVPSSGAEPEVLDRAAWEFADAESFLAAAESITGGTPTFGVDTMFSPSTKFLYGGMENPSVWPSWHPSLLTGDRSLVDVLAHEIAHSGPEI